jgi:hypothetical protein
MDWGYSLPARCAKKTVTVTTTLLAILAVDFFASASDKEESHKIETESDKAGGCRESRYLLNGRHHLGDSVKNPYTSQYQCNGPDELGLIHLFVGHGST